MTPDRFEEIKTMVKRQYPSFEEGVSDMVAHTADGEVKQGEAEFIIFENPIGRIKLEFQKKPKVEEKKYHYSHRQGQSARVEYKFSDSEMVYTLKAYKWNEDTDDWKEIDAGSFAAGT